MKNLVSALAMLVVIVVFVGAPADAHACMPGFVHPQKEVILFWHDGTEILVWRARVTPASGGGLGTLGAEPPTPAPSRTQLAWVLAVPSEPLAFHVVDNEDFDRTQSWTLSVRAFSQMEGRGGGGIGFGSGGLDIGETVRAGEYDITPIQAEGATAARELNTWLTCNRFPEANAEAANAYAAEGATFLAVKARVPRGTSTIDLRPLAIAFRSQQIVLPVRLSAGETPFGLNATVFSTRVPNLGSTLTHGLGISTVRPFGQPADPEVIGRVSIVPSGNIPAEMRSLIAPITSEVPGYERMLTGSVAVSLIAAQPLTIAVDQPDPSIALGGEVAPDAPAGVAHAGHWDQVGNFVLGAAPPAEVPEAAEAAATGAATSAGQPPGAATVDAEDADDGGMCSAAGRQSPGSGLAIGLALALIALRRRR